MSRNDRSFFGWAQPRWVTTVLVALDRSWKPLLIIAPPIYACSMGVFPFVESRGDWQHIQAVWTRWQPLNVSVIALLSSVFLYRAATARERQREKREFQAAIAALPSMLSELHGFARAAFAELSKAFSDSKAREAAHTPLNPSPNPSMPSIAMPNAPVGFTLVFADCIRHSDSDELARELSDILAMSQIFSARLERLYTKPSITENLFRIDLVYRMYDLGEMMVFVNRLWEIARSIGDGRDSPIGIDQFNSVYLSGGVAPGNFNVTSKLTLEDITKARVDSKEVPQFRFIK